ncbi:MAG: PilT/PilU family type 4a pilus ATPase [Candidatus Omnitrophica bacterium]|nr:PilT/PilU family type 4a pilus ATPase [Candidatus Omnitrophota bacterium]
MMSNEDEKRRDKRFSCRIPMKYEIIRKEGGSDIVFSTIIRDVSSSGLSFYTFEIINLDCLVKVFFHISSEESISFVAKVSRVEKSWAGELGTYIVGVQIERIDEDVREKLRKFLGYCDIEGILEKIDLKGVLDIHFLADYFLMVKKFGHVIPVQEERLSKEIVQGLLLSILTDHQYKVFTEAREINFIFTHKDIRFRVNLHFQQGKIEGIFRIIPPKIKTLKELGLPPIVRNFLTHKKGLIMVAGRTGSGKTTTLASMVEYLNDIRDGVLLCIEDPVEYIHTNKKCIIKQREVGKDTLSFYNAAKNALRQNPDVLIIGEIIDVDTMEVALTAAESGTLVLTSLHAPNSAYALDRIVSLFAADLQSHILTRLSLVLIGLITQELIPRVDKEGLILSSEILVINNAMRRIIRQGDWKQIPTILQTSKDIGTQSMESSIRTLYEEELISEDYLREYLI